MSLAQLRSSFFDLGRFLVSLVKTQQFGDDTQLFLSNGADLNASEMCIQFSGAVCVWFSNSMEHSYVIQSVCQYRSGEGKK